MKTKLLIVFAFCTFNLFSQTNLVQNGGFENWTNYTTLSQWITENTVTQNTSNFTEGFSSAKLAINYSAYAPKITTQVPMVAGTTYTIKFKYKYVGSNYNSQHPIALNISQNGSATTLSSSTFATDNNWTVKETTFTPDQSMSYNLSFSLFSFDAASFSVNIDAVQVYIKDTEQYTLIPDQNFENKLIALGIDYGIVDGKVLTSDINKLTYLNVSSSSIADLTGIQDFTGLTILDCSNNQLTSLNTPKSGALTNLTCSYNQLSALDVSANLGLKKLDCYTNQLTTLDISKNTALTDVSASYNKLSVLDVSSNLDLKSLHCYNNQFTTLDVSKNLALNSFYCSNNKITALDVSANLALTDLDCTKNKITNLDISKNTALVLFSCGANQLTTLNVSKNTALKSLICGNNQLTTLDVSNNPALNYLYCTENKLTSLNVSKNVALTALHCYLNQITDLNVSKNVALKNFNCYGNDLTSLDVSKNPALAFLYCQSNLLTILDVSKNPKLTELNCSNNRLRNLNLKNGNNTSLDMRYCRFYGNQYLDCIQVDNATYSTDYWSNAKDYLANYNEICEPYTAIPDYFFEQKLVDLGIDKDGINGKVATSSIVSVASLNVSKSSISDLTGIQDFTSLTQLDVSENLLTNLDISGNTKLENLQAQKNKLVSLDISTNPKIIKLACNNNKLTLLNLRNGANTNLDLTYSNFSNNPDLKCIKVDDVAYSVANWSSIKDATANYGLDECVFYTLIPDVNFENKLISLGIDSGTPDGKVDTAKISNLISLDVADSSISDLTGLQDFTALKYFFCDRNKITNVDFSKNIMLENISVLENNLTSLDVRKNTQLHSLELSNNKITSLDVSQNTNLKGLGFNFNKITEINLTSNNLTELHCRGNNLTQVKVTNQPNLTILECGLNKMTSIDLSANKKLEELECANMGLTSLDIAENKELVIINAFGNELTSLDVSQNPKLKALYVEFNPLVTLNLQNGNNENFILANPTNKSKMIVYTSFLNNPNLSCIQVDDVAFSNANWSKIKDGTASYNLDCNQYTSIPDPNFEDKLIALDIDKDGKNGKIQTANINKVTYLDLSSSNISDITGIEGFTSLTYLDCNFNLLSNIDVSQNKLLTKLSLHENQLTSLDLSANTELFNLTFSKNQISSIDLSNNKKLHNLGADRNSLTKLDVSANKELEMLYCGENKLSELNVSTLTNLILLDCGFTNLKQLNLSANTKLEALYCHNTPVTSLDLSQNVQLKTLNAMANQLTTLDLSHNPLLTLAFLELNPLETLNVQNGNNENFTLPSDSGKKAASGLYTSFLGNAKLSCIKVDNVAFSNANWSKIKEVNTVYSATCSLGLEESVFDKVVLFPNPTKGEISINNVILEKATVYNTLGQLVKSFTLDSGNTTNTINLHGLPRGVYYVYLINQDAASAKKIIVE